MGWSHGYHTLWPGIGPLLGTQGPQKDPLWPKMPLLGVLEVLGGPGGAIFGLNSLELPWTHGCTTDFGLVSSLFLAAILIFGPVLGPTWSKKETFRAKRALLGPLAARKRPPTMGPT